MKKYCIFIIVLVASVLLCVPVSAQSVVNVEYILSGTEIILPQTNPAGLIEVNGVKYIDTGKPNRPTIKYVGNENFLESYRRIEAVKGRIGEGIWTGEYYIFRSAGYDSINAPEYAKDWPSTLEVFDKTGDLIKEVTFDDYIRGVSYVDGVYYCLLDTPDSHYYKMSTDLENWETYRGPIPREFHNMIYKSAFISREDSSVSFNGTDYYALQKESEGIYYVPTSYLNNKEVQFGELKFLIGDQYLYVSNDNIYDVKFPLSENLENYRSYYDFVSYSYMKQIQQIYEDGDNLVIYSSNFRLTIPKQHVYDALKALKDAPYVIVNDTILGFDNPPVMEDDRTLVPMRFLFEQLGAEVQWDEATQSATATNGDTAVTFSINNRAATVDGQTATMDVPARLINDKTMVPLRFLSEELGYTVEWDEETRCATVITTDNNETTVTE